MKKPLVSVVIPFYSELNWLDEALHSVKNQTYDNLEVLVVNDGSPEDPTSVMEKYNNFAFLINKENGGPSSARNLGIEKSAGKYIAFLDSDDIWMPKKVEMQVKLMEETKNAWSQHSYEYFWDQENKTKVTNTSIYQGDVYVDCFISLKIQTSCVMVRKDVLLNEDIIFPLDKRYGQDGAFYKQIAKNHNLGYLDGVFSKFRIRGSNAGFRAEVQLKSRADTWKEIKKDNEILKRLPFLAKVAYRVSYFNNLLASKVTVNANRRYKESIYKIFYSIPYLLFKTTSIRYK
ncbi:glycosyltransferase family 2 protein [Alkalibacillus salilacus]|uniref:Glycosyltransferase involved in cell wall biosynthesis n=1 Tax=Alkalibacillus salilacus TaxID=284582 RepID=A0ABT9VHX7_9BACI|nr:glycosyltransferase family A protein [Alkalibacillus salilacus]MDQ0160557.1 glycosyltransferase involved in cell wall biosynthesis [Alkalibacillus salilacus]